MIIIDNLYLELVHNLLVSIKKGQVSIEKKEKLYNIVRELKYRTEKQKRRFILYYKLNPKNQELDYTYSSIGKMEGCTPTAVRCSIMRVRSSLVHLTEVQKQIVMDISKL